MDGLSISLGKARISVWKMWMFLSGLEVPTPRGVGTHTTRGASEKEKEKERQRRETLPWMGVSQCCSDPDIPSSTRVAGFVAGILFSRARSQQVRPGCHPSFFRLRHVQCLPVRRCTLWRLIPCVAPPSHTGGTTVHYIDAWISVASVVQIEKNKR